MPKELFEIKKFDKGIISTPSDEDIPQEAASYSLDLETVSVDGKLQGRKKDTQLVADKGKIDKAVFIDNPDNTKKDLIYISDDNLKSSSDFYGSTPGGEADVDHGDIGASGSNAMVVNNKEVHIGTGNTANSNTKWIGYTQSTQFGQTNDEKIVENDRLEQITELPSFSMSIEDATHIFGVNQDGTKIIKVDKSTYLFEESDYTFQKITAICLQGPKSTNAVTGENLWVCDANRGGENVSGGIGLVQRSNLQAMRWEDLTYLDYGRTDGFIISDMIDNQEYLHVAFYKDSSTSNYVGPYFNSSLKNDEYPNGEVGMTISDHADAGSSKLVITTSENGTASKSHSLGNYYTAYHPFSENGTRHTVAGMSIKITGSSSYVGTHTIDSITDNTITITNLTYNATTDISDLKWEIVSTPSKTHLYNGSGDLKCFPLMGRFTQTSPGNSTTMIKGFASGHNASSFVEAHPIANNQPLEARAIRLQDGDAGKDHTFEHGYYSTLGNIYKTENSSTEQDYDDVYLYAKTLKFPFVPANDNSTYPSGKAKASFYYMFKELKNGTISGSDSSEIHVTTYDEGGTATNRSGRPPSYDFMEVGGATNPAPYSYQKAQLDNYQCWTQPIRTSTKINLVGILMMSNWSNDGSRAWNAWDRVDRNNVPDGGISVAGQHYSYWVEKTNDYNDGAYQDDFTMEQGDDHNIGASKFGDDLYLNVQFGEFGDYAGNPLGSRALNHNKWGKPDESQIDVNGLTKGGNIIDFADGPSGDQTDTEIEMASAHSLTTGDKVNITGSDNYDGREIEVTVTSTTKFVINKAYVAENAGGTAYDEKYVKIPSYPITYYINNLGTQDTDTDFKISHSDGGGVPMYLSSISGIGTFLNDNALGKGKMKFLQDLRRIPMGHILASDIDEGVNGRTFYPIQDTNYLNGSKYFYDDGNNYTDPEGSCAIMMGFKYDDNDISSGSWDMESKNTHISQFIPAYGEKAHYIFTGESSDDDLLHQAFFPDIWSSGMHSLNHARKTAGGGMLQQPRDVGISRQILTDVTMTQITDVGDNLSINTSDYGTIEGGSAIFSSNMNDADARIHVWDNTRLMSFESTQGGRQGFDGDGPATFGTGTPRAESLLAPTLNQSPNLTAIPGLLPPGRWSTFGFSFEYDGYQEGPINALGTKEEGEYIDENDHDQGEKGFLISLQLRATNLSKRITAVNMYVAESFDASPGQGGLFRLIDRIPTETGWSTVADSFWGDVYNLVEEYQWRGQRSSTYESLTGIPEAIKRTMVNYNLSTELNNTLFVTDIYHQDLTTSGNYVIRSLPYKYSMFDIVHDQLRLPEKPTAITSFAGRVWVFSENNTYKIEPNNFYIEDTFNGVGCASQNSVIVTEYGMCFANSNNVYLHDGNFPQPIGEKILKIEYGSDYGYKSLYKADGFEPFVLFDGTRNSFMIIMSNRYALTFNVLRKKWDLWTTPGSETTNTGTPDFYTAFNSKDGTIHISKKHDEAGTDVIPLFAYANHPSLEMPWKWVSKTLTMGQSTQDKKFYDSNLIGDGSITELEGADGSLNVNGFPHKSKNIKLTVEGSNQQTIDAIGLVFRRYIKVFKGVSG